MKNNNNLSFNDLGINNKFLIDKINNLNYKPFPVQIKCIPEILNNINIVGIANTGSGKTLSFVLPILEILYNKNINIIILEPTRELSLQVEKVFKIFINDINKIKIANLYGGVGYTNQLEILKKNPQIIIGTPGRIIDHIKKKNLNINNISIVVIDESDEMLKMGFINDIKFILSNIKNKYQIILFSATMPNYIYTNIIDKIIKKYKKITVENKFDIKPNIKQEYCIINNDNNKNLILTKMIEINKNLGSIIIFVNRKISTIELSNYLKNLGYNTSYLNGDLIQKIRERTIELFKKSKIDILVATDIASRGIDIDNINLVINYDSPNNLETYIHRIGRTGRAGRSGKSIIFIKNIKFLKIINKKFNNINKINYPNNKIMIEIIFNKITDDIKNQYLKLEYEKNINYYNNIIKKLLCFTDNNINKLSIILFKLIQNNNKLYNLFINKN
ncbi:DEAD/DEAH box helicase [Candidatus Nardonella dryophthoridicola]|uniref:ATP-dependent RNA helicase DeaD n=1 Tax=endosymbiont of Rhynchophorus ferrugineus TaxID=1972133 RepID=A0A2Z5T3M0_9GAMM|nr:DEAD/DEAH box helicase [Candidatus Nardonella dryophthoridicola]QTJ62938.1 DEAD/DEAH box helicase [Candidatus Nardonella dryophthoridicola]BBA84990.1 ATP-dependent RNA helicase DeaD [endosymbiont of Rhynchophorus ferrugineus]